MKLIVEAFRSNTEDVTTSAFLYICHGGYIVSEIDNSEERTVSAVVTIEFSCASKCITQLKVMRTFPDIGFPARWPHPEQDYS